MKNRNKDAGTAYHEAGHAVAACCLGLDVVSATIVPDQVSNGRVYPKSVTGKR